ncbi:P-loop containing nucleoside triphosphate hydrolases superfamily protein [Cinnamomum micranthum f. kanehirae]|uniref:P-loop containing nucleoside triphosphate hydrolases superfamily protein n=1 Tax=Cinnamomum micranthum f. kanehirae TaxID=337451 RepID=A0A443PF64_9MAGN|nr:P-loop containing nucleoside triphosphate hydrolases superfamily protein [Cinnamomum micranthum f. kanehirae]
MENDGYTKFILLQIFALSSIGFFTAAMHLFRKRGRRRALSDNKVVPRLATTESGRVDRVERFSHYVARQLGFEDANECPQLSKLAHDYLRKSKDCEENIYAFFSNDRNGDSLYVKLIEEFDKCILGYFAFHWCHATHFISQVLSVDSESTKKLRDMVMAATRKQRFERITRSLKVTRVFNTLVEEMKAIGIASNDDSHCTEVMVPAALSERSPVLLLMGGGMGAGKSTVLKDILKESFWLGAGGNAVVVEADAFKETDVIYRALNSRGHHHDMLQTAELVHQSSTDAASSLLVTALNEGRDVIMDGTLSWEPFVKQMIAMARNVHRHRYRMGVGYKVSDDGAVIENYWEQVEEEQEDGLDNKRKPYRIELVGVVCDSYLAVVRGIRRAILMGRAVRVNSQLKSHKRFASAFPRYCQLVDHARLYCTNAIGTPPKLIGWKDGDNNILVDPQEIDCLSKVSKLNEGADSIYELYPEAETTCGSGSIWNEVVMAPSRARLQHELKIAIQKLEV